VHQRLVLVVGFDVERLVAILGNLAVQSWMWFELLAGRLVSFGGVLGFFKLGLGGCQLFLDDGNALGKRRDLFFQRWIPCRLPATRSGLEVLKHEG